MRYMIPVGRILFALIFISAAPLPFTHEGIQRATDLGVPAASLPVPISGTLALLGGLRNRSCSPLSQNQRLNRHPYDERAERSVTRVDSRADSEQQGGFPMRYFALAFAWAWVFWAIPLAMTCGWLTQPALVEPRVSLLVVGAYAPFVAAFALSFRDETAWTLLKCVVPNATAANNENFNRTTSGS